MALYLKNNKKNKKKSERYELVLRLDMMPAVQFHFVPIGKSPVTTF